MKILKILKIKNVKYFFFNNIIEKVLIDSENIVDDDFKKII